MTTTTVEPPSAPPEEPTRRIQLSEVSWPELASTIGLVVMAIIFAVINPGYLSEGNVSAILQASAILIVLTIGQTFVIATGGIDLSVASTMTLGAIVLGEFYAAGAGIGVAALAGFVAAGVVGLINGLLISKGGITDFIVTLGTLSAASGLALIIADGQKTTIVEPFLLKMSVNGIWIFSWSVLLAIALAVIAHVVLFHTRFGVHVLAIGGSEEASRAVGIRTWMVKTGVYVISGSLRRRRRAAARGPGGRLRAGRQHQLPAQLGRRRRTRRGEPLRRPRHHRRPRRRRPAADRPGQRPDPGRTLGVLPTPDRRHRRGAGRVHHEVPEMTNSTPTAVAPDDMLTVRDVRKSFGRVQALRSASMSVPRGQLTAIVGDNGAGKSTLVKCLVGVHARDGGEVLLDGAPVHFTNPQQARSAGIETVFQDLALVEDLTVAQNLFLSREETRARLPRPSPDAPRGARHGQQARDQRAAGQRAGTSPQSAASARPCRSPGPPASPPS